MPFLMFQEKDESDDDVIEEQSDEPEVVWKRLVALDSITIAIMMMSSGVKVPATKYVAGDDGFIICHWDEQKEKYETNMSNDLLAENAAFINKPSPPVPQPKKSPTTPKPKKKDAKPKSAKKKPAKTKKATKKKPAAAEPDEHSGEPPAEPDREAEVQFVAAL